MCSTLCESMCCVSLCFISGAWSCGCDFSCSKALEADRLVNAVNTSPRAPAKLRSEMLLGTSPKSHEVPKTAHCGMRCQLRLSIHGFFQHLHNNPDSLCSLYLIHSDFGHSIAANKKPDATTNESYCTSSAHQATSARSCRIFRAAFRSSLAQSDFKCGKIEPGSLRRKQTQLASGGAKLFLSAQGSRYVTAKSQGCSRAKLQERRSKFKRSTPNDTPWHRSEKCWDYVRSMFNLRTLQGKLALSHSSLTLLLFDHRELKSRLSLLPAHGSVCGKASKQLAFIIFYRILGCGLTSDVPV